jgi:pimeloyl-ACP methyl ester carboxylesterase
VKLIPISLAILLSVGSFWLADRAVRDLPPRVDADGRLLRMRIEGHGSPAVVLEIGLGGPLEVWELVQPEVAKFTKVVSYDRIGAVDTKPKRTGLDVAEELRAALRNAGVEPPYVLVGQSFGGVYNRIFASWYPNDVAGLVLLDPTQEEFLDWLNVHYPEETLSKEIVKRWAEGAGVWDTLDELAAAPPLPDVPVVVVTATKFIDDPMHIESQPVWTAAHAKWVTALPSGRHVLAPNSGHGVEIEAPQLVVELIRDVVEQARRRRSVGDESQIDVMAHALRGEP